MTLADSNTLKVERVTRFYPNSTRFGNKIWSHSFSQGDGRIPRDDGRALFRADGGERARVFFVLGLCQDLRLEVKFALQIILDLVTITTYSGH